jgi:hypothetical protein
VAILYSQERTEPVWKGAMFCQARMNVSCVASSASRRLVAGAGRR